MIANYAPIEYVLLIMKEGYIPEWFKTESDERAISIANGTCNNYGVKGALVIEETGKLVKLIGY